MKYGIPIAKRYIWPHAKDALIRTASDIIEERGPAREVLKNNSKAFIKNIGSSIATKLVQEGSGLGRKRKASSNVTNFLPLKQSKLRQIQKKGKKQKKTKPKKTIRKTDFISTCL